MFWVLIETLDEEKKSVVEDIYIRYQKKIYHKALDIVKNHHDAEEIVDDVAVKIIKNVDKFINVTEKDIQAQLHIYVECSAIDKYRRNDYRRSKEELVEEIEAVEFDVHKDDGINELENMVINKDEIQRAFVIIQKMPTKKRNALLLVWAHGYSNKEAAAILGITPNAVSQRVTAAKKELINML